ncbi:hypothetical protein AZE42_03081, partial [Rhizopogon vesiculosus]
EVYTQAEGVSSWQSYPDKEGDCEYPHQTLRYASGSCSIVSWANQRRNAPEIILI